MEIVLLGLVVLVMAVVIIRREYIKTKLQSKKNLENSAAQLQLQIEEVADTVIQRIENRMNEMELLLLEVDAKLGQLDEKLQETRLAEENLEKTMQAVSKVAVAVEKSQEVQQVPVNLAPLKEEVPKKKKSEMPISKINQNVLDLFASGYTMDEVAKKTGMGKGALLLIREMHKE